MAKWTAQNIPDLSGRTALVTGANGGLGYHTALELALHGAQVVIACRNRDKAEAALAKMRASAPQAAIELMIVDMSDLESVGALAAQFRAAHDGLDLLINNAGIVMPPFRKTKQDFESQIGTNFLGPFALTGLLLPELEKRVGARIVNIASQAHRMGGLDLSDLHFSRRTYNEKKGYGQSKLAILLWTFEMQRRLAANKLSISALAAHPGYAATNLASSDMKLASTWIGRLALKLGNLFANSAHQGALCTLYAAVESAAQGGDYIGPDGIAEMRGAPRKVSSSPASRDADLAAALWAHAEQLTSVSYLS